MPKNQLNLRILLLKNGWHRVIEIIKLAREKDSMSINIKVDNYTEMDGRWIFRKIVLYRRYSKVSCDMIIKERYPSKQSISN